jgi:hypothetical protein
MSWRRGYRVLRSRGRPKLFATSAVATLLMTIAAQGATISPSEYAERLDRIAKAVTVGDLRRVRTDAKALLKKEVGGPHGKSGTDTTILGPLSRARSEEGARGYTDRIAQLIESLESQESQETDTGKPREPDPSEADNELLDRIREREALGDARAGGKVAGFPYRDNDFSTWIQNKLADAAEWVWEWIGPRVRGAVGDFVDWLLRLFLGNSISSGDGGVDVTRLVVVVLVVVAAIVGVLLAWHVVRSRRRSVAPVKTDSAKPVAPAQDEDALSRTATEWERYAAELEAAGRAREAIRAWYHALLVTLFRAGHLHHRKGRTNWEYAFALAPGIIWRSRFTEIVRSFEREWYGRTSSQADVEHMFAGEAKALLRDVRGGAK